MSGEESRWMMCEEKEVGMMERRGEGGEEGRRWCLK